jgi:hypothetical protein
MMESMIEVHSCIFNICRSIRRSNGQVVTRGCTCLLIPSLALCCQKCYGCGLPWLVKSHSQYQYRWTWNLVSWMNIHAQLFSWRPRWWRLSHWAWPSLLPSLQTRYLAFRRYHLHECVYVYVLFSASLCTGSLRILSKILFSTFYDFENKFFIPFVLRFLLLLYI